MKKHNITFSVSGTKGDIHPLLQVAAALQTQNVNVTFQANEYFKAEIEACGVSFASLGTTEMYLKANEDPEMWNPATCMMEVNAKYSLLQEILDGYNYVSERRAKTSLVITCRSLNGARLAATKFGLPQIVFAHAPSAIFSAAAPAAPTSWLIPQWMPNEMYFLIQRIKFLIKRIISTRPEFSRRLNSLYDTLEVTKRQVVSSESLKSAAVIIGLFPEWFSEIPKDWPHNVRLVGFPFSSVNSDLAMSTANAFINKNGKPILFTGGTGVRNTTEFFDKGKQICAILQKPGLFVGGDGTAFCCSSPELLHVHQINFDQVLPKCLAIVHHGGIGTVSSAIRAGIPQLIRPLKIDQPNNAERVKQLGLGAFVLPSNFHPEKIARYLQVMTSKDWNAETLEKWANAARTSRAVESSCEIILEQLASIERST